MITLGCDPEVFLRNPAGNFISSIGLIGGSKKTPMPIGEGCAVQEDNVTVEFNTPPCDNIEAFIKAINYNKEYIKSRAKELGLEMCIKPSAEFNELELSSYEAQTFGCEPDFNAWRNGKANQRPNTKNKSLRSCGGHIHISLPRDVNILEVVKAMDLFVGCLMIEFDDDTDRRLLYGKSGAYRPKSYGVEYRTPSNVWIKDEEKIRWIWAQTEKAVAFVKTGHKFNESQGKMIQDCINNSDHTLLQILKEEFKLND